MLAKIERLIKIGEVNGNNTLLEPKSFNRAVDKYLCYNGALRIDGITIEERNELIKKNKLYPSCFNIVGEVLSYDDTHVYVNILSDIKNINEYKCEFFVDATKIDSKEEYNIFKVEAIKAIILTKK